MTMALEMISSVTSVLGVSDLTPWWTQPTATNFGAFGGAAFGVLGGGLGAALGWLAPQGKAKSFILTSLTLMIAAAVVLFFTGIIALTLGQPYHVWYFPTLLGTIGAAVIGSLFPLVLMRYRQAEARRFDAEALKRS